MNFYCSYDNQQKKKMNSFYFLYTGVFVIAILISWYISITSVSEVKLLLWFLVGFLGMGEALLSVAWMDYRTWVLSKRGDSISYCNRFGKVREIQVIHIEKIYVNAYGKIKLYRENGKVFLARNISEYPGMYELMLALRDKDSMFEFENDVTKERFWEALEIVERDYIKR